MAAAGAVVSEALQAIVEHAKLGQPTADVLARHGACSPFVNYQPRWARTPFPAVLCVVPNRSRRTFRTARYFADSSSGNERSAPILTR